jgi:hypothetical protein
MPLADLITSARAAQNATLAALGTSNPSYLASLITAASDLIRRRCSRDFVQNTYSEYHSGGIFIGEPLRLRQFPILEITRVAGCPLPALCVINTDTATNQRATVETTATGLTLFRMASGTATTTSLASSTYPTVGQIATAINALGSGWSATPQAQTLGGDFSRWPTNDFKPLQGATSAFLGGAFLEMYTEDVQPFLSSSFCSAGDDDCGYCGNWSSAGWRLDDQTGELFGRFPRGRLNIRIDYSAGFATIPQPLQEATVQLTQDLYQASLVNSTLKKATLGSASFELKSASSAVQLSGKVEALIASFIDHSRMISR